MSASIVQRIAVIFEGQASQYLQTVQAVESQTSKLVGGVAATGAAISASVTAPFTAFSAKAIDTFNQYESALSRMEGLVGLSKDEISGFSEEIKRVAVEVGKSPIELAAAMENITSSGIKGDAAIETLNATARAAAGGLGEVRSVSDTVTSAMNAYGVANLSATEATDILVAAVREGKAEAETFAPVLGGVLPIANEMGIGFDEAAGSIAYLTLSTGSASTAATQYQNLLAQIIRLKPNKEAGKILTQAGVDIEAFQKKVSDEGMLPALMDLKQQLAGVGLTMKDAFPDVQAMTAALQMTGSNSEQAAKVLAGVANATGAVDGAFEAATKTTQFGYNVAMAEMQVTLIEFRDLLAPVMLSSNKLMKLAIGEWKNLSTETKKYVVTALTVVSASGPILLGLSGFLYMLPQIAGGLNVVRGSITALGAVARSALIPLIVPWLPIIAIVSAVTAVVAGLAYYIVGPEGLKNAWDVTKEAVLSFVSTAMGFMANFSTNMGILSEWLRTNWMTIFTDMGNVVSTLVVNTVTNIGVLVQTMTNLFFAFLGWYSIAVPAMFNKVFNYDTWGYIMTFIGNMFSYFGTFLSSLASMFVAGLQIVTGVFSAWGRAVIGVILGISDVLGKAISAILSGSMPDPVQMLKDFGAVVATKAGEFATDAGAKIMEATGQIGEALAAEGQMMADSFDKGASDLNFFDTAGDIIAEGVAKMKGPLDGFESQLTSMPEFVFATEGDPAQEIEKLNAGVKAATTSATDSLKGIDAVNQEIAEGAGSAGDAAEESANNVDKLAEKATAAAGAVEGVFQGSLASAIKIDEFMNKLGEVGKEKKEPVTKATTTGAATQDVSGSTHEGRVEKLLATIAVNTNKQFGPANLAS